jgi:hypothetical protein
VFSGQREVKGGRAHDVVVVLPVSRDGILGHQFNKILECFALCYSQSLLLADFQESHSLL